MKPVSLPCAIYTRKSSEEGLEQDFNSLDAQREACAAYILSQKALGWKAVPSVYDDGGFSGGNTERPALQRLLADIALGKVKVVVVYKVDRLTRSLADFAKMVELFDAQGVSFVSVTQQFNTTTSMGRLTLNVLLSFAQFEREVTGERIRDKIAASKQKGLWMGGIPPVGYRPEGRTLVPVPEQAERIVAIFELYLELGCVSRLKAELERRDWRTPARNTHRADQGGNRPFSRGHLYRILSNPIYIGRIPHKETSYEGNHPAIVGQDLWDEVQAQLQSNQQGQKTRTHAKEPSLLAGLVWDEDGNPLIASHANKAGKRYRYYIHGTKVQEAIQEEIGSVREVLRIPAQELEALVVQELVRWLRNEAEVLQALKQLGQLAPSTIRQTLAQAKAWAAQLEASNGAETITVIQRLLKAVMIGDAQLDVQIQVRALIEGKQDQPAADSEHVIHRFVQAQLRRCGMAMRLVVDASSDESAAQRACSQPDQHLVQLLQRAHRAVHQLLTGQVGSTAELAKAQGVSMSWMTRVMYLGFMAPDLVKRIGSGDHPASLSADRLLRMSPLPMDWDEQRRVLWMG
ncbi:recombinase family protein [Ottowia testudinis]|uniref:Recombinase family protein n=1 Tax=Ottowia testudinis TaxID=2816950 RepID=A0A975H400_9BURK|nr:recombinase family protein [Ottowia testudinis]QTD46339.1 recombinase family protein [Ottowia testudinis]